MTPQLEAAIHREARILTQALELIDWMARDVCLDLEDVFDALDTAVKGFKNRTAVASWEDAPQS